MVPAMKVSRVWALLWGTMDVSPPPAASVESPWLPSQARSATSWVLPSDGLAIFRPRRSAAVLISGRTTRNAPPEVDPEMTRTASPLDCEKALMAGLGPMKVMSIASANMASMAWVPELKGVTSMVALGSSLVSGPPSASSTRPGAWVMFGNTPKRTVTAASMGPGTPSSAEMAATGAGLGGGATPPHDTVSTRVMAARAGTLPPTDEPIGSPFGCSHILAFIDQQTEH